MPTHSPFTDYPPSPDAYSLEIAVAVFWPTHQTNTMEALEKPRQNLQVRGNGIHQRDQMAATHRNHRRHLESFVVFCRHAPEVHGEQTGSCECRWHGAWSIVCPLRHRPRPGHSCIATPDELVRQNLRRSHYSIRTLSGRTWFTQGTGSPGEWIDIKITGCFSFVQGYVAGVHHPG